MKTSLRTVLPAAQPHGPGALPAFESLPRLVSWRRGPACAPGTSLDTAITRLENGQWRQAYASCTSLADEGDVPAARLALLMHLRGTRLFGGHFEASALQRQRWSSLIDEGLSP